MTGSKVEGRRKGFKGLSPRLAPEKVYIRLPKDLAVWLREYSEAQRKSLSVIVTEALQKERERLLSQSTQAMDREACSPSACKTMRMGTIL